MSLEILVEFRNNLLRIRKPIDGSSALFLEYPDVFIISLTYIGPKYLSNLSLVSIDYVVKIIDL